MSLSLLIPDDLHTQLRACAQLQHASVDVFALAQRQSAAMRLVGMGKHWAPERDSVAELIRERVADDAN